MRLYDANIFKVLDYEMLCSLIKDKENYLTDDTVLELLKAKRLYSNAERFVQNLDLVLKDDSGLNDSFSLVASRIPFCELAKVVENTRLVGFIKSTPLSCVIYHLWLTFTLSPSGISFMNRTINSLLTDYSKQGLITESNKNKIENLKNKLRFIEKENASKHYNHENVALDRLIKTWAKRNTDISNHKFSYTDAKIVVASLSMLLKYRKDIEIVTADYDLVDLQYNLFLSIYDHYTVKKVLDRHCELLNLQTDEVSSILVPLKEIKEEYEKTFERINNSKEKISHTVWFYEQQSKKYESFSYDIPDFIYEFVSEYTGNFYCFEIDDSTSLFYKNRMNYKWYMPNPGDKMVKYDVWLKNSNKSRKIFPACKSCCKYEMDEMNNSKNISSFII